jgi:multiple sugar transport system substrate-binding protein
LAVSKYSTHKQLALEFLAFLVSPQVQVHEYVDFHKFPISKEAFQMLLSNSTLSPHDKELLDAVYNAAQNAWANPPNIPPTYTELIPSFNQEVYSYLLGQIGAQEAMNTAAASWVNALVQTYGSCSG